jgi:hypothetical protein
MIMKKLYFLVFLVLIGCQTKNNKSESEVADGSTEGDLKVENPLLNITILWDLSDRISPSINPATPEHFQRDTAIIKTFAEVFVKDIHTRGTFFAKSKIRIIFSPQPEDPNINEMAKRLSVDLQGRDHERIADIYKNIIRNFPENAMEIYNASITNGNWDGSDIWRFFKNDVRDFCIAKEENYRNILVILTDGYIYHKNSKDQIGNKYAYILPDLFKKNNLRGNPNWEQELDERGFGLIASRNDLQDLEILVLEVTPSPEYPNDEYIIKKVLSNWFTEMNVKRFAIYNSDLPFYTRDRIIDFLGN